MKNFKTKLAIASIALVTLFSSAPARAEAGAYLNNLAVHSELYVWNRLADFLEITRAGIAVGPAVGFEVAFTEHAQLGAYASREIGAAFPVVFPTFPVPPVIPTVLPVLSDKDGIMPPLWTVPFLEGEQVFKKHSGAYATAVFGPHRRETSIDASRRFARNTWDIRAQIGLGLCHAYMSVDPLEGYDFIAGLFCIDPKQDDEKLDPTAKREPGRQLGRGFANVFGSVVEVPMTMINVNKRDGDFAGATTGVMKGTWQAFVRLSVGVTEIVTFPMGWEPIIEPEYPLQPTRSTDWSIHRPGFRDRL